MEGRDEGRLKDRLMKFENDPFYNLFDAQGLAVKKDSDIYKAMDILARQVGIIGISLDWPATVTCCANSMGLK